jgi:hypothetical protein
MKPFKGNGAMPLVQLAIMEFCKRERGIQEIALAFGMSYKSTTHKIDQMKCAGRLQRVKRGIYRSAA